MTVRHPLPLFGVLLLLATVSVSAADEADQVLAEFGEQVITVEGFKAEMMDRGGHLPGSYASVDDRRLLLDLLIERQALIAEAYAAGYDRDPQVVAVMEKIMVDRLRQDRLQPDLAGIEVSDQEVALYYDIHRDEYARPARSRAAIVYFKVGAEAPEERVAKVEARVAAATAELEALEPDPGHFGAVARRYSDDRASRYQGGVIGWLVESYNRAYRWEADVVAAVYELENVGDVASLRTDQGFYLVRLVDREKSEPRPLKDLETGIRARLIKQQQRELRARFLAEITANNIRVDEELLAAIEPLAPPAGADDRTPPPLPGVAGEPAGG